MQTTVCLSLLTLPNSGCEVSTGRFLTRTRAFQPTALTRSYTDLQLTSKVYNEQQLTPKAYTDLQLTPKAGQAT